MGGGLKVKVKPCDKWTRHNVNVKGYNMTWLTLLPKLIAGLSPEVKKEITDALDKMQAKAAATKLPFDDLGVAMLRMMLGC